MSSDPQLTPMMAQYRRIKAELPQDALLFFRLGDFYEMFFEDAQIGAQILGVALTKRGLVPMCGIPYHSANGYIAKILAAGRKAAICDQVEEARPGQLVKREVTQILSPGSHLDDKLLHAEKNNYLAAVYPAGKTCGLAFVDLTTGDFQATELEGAELSGELERLRPVELIHPALETGWKASTPGFQGVVEGYEDWVFAPETAQFTLLEHFKVASLDGFGLRDRPAAIGAAGAILHYLGQHLRRDLSHLTRLSCYRRSEFLQIDATSLRNLEVLEPLSRDAAKQCCLLGVLNRTVTPMGARRLREWLTQPLRQSGRIWARQKAVCRWLEAEEACRSFRELLSEVRDLERTLSRLCQGSGNGRDLQALRLALEQLPALRKRISEAASTEPSQLREPFFSGNGFASNEPEGEPGNLLAELSAEIGHFPALIEAIARAIVDEPPLGVKEGGLIRDGFDAGLDEFRSATRDGKEWIARLQQEEIERTGINTLKVRFNSVFGYYIEVTKSHLDKVPADYIRKQTVANAERFITPGLKEVEGKILGAEERSTKLEYELFLKIREMVLGHLKEIQQTATALGKIDVLATFAEDARMNRYICPEVRDEGVLQIQGGRHPVLDQSNTQERFVPNDVQLDHATQIMLITGPNMAGKSTYIRQVALLALLAHTGSFIPAEAGRVDLLDRIFTRIGASDDLSRGQSTFMVEMSETANILNHATPRSLVILDEIGRGTSTFDGLSLAWSIVEHLHHQVGAKTLFATHYHELTELSGRLVRVKNFNVAVREWNEQIVFLRKIVEGGTDKSYGIQVARLAGVPRPVLERAREILGNLEEAELTPEGKVRGGNRHRAEREKLHKLAPLPQLDLFG